MLTLRFFFPSIMPIYGPLYMDNSLTSCLCYFIYLYRTVVKRSDSLLLFIYSPTRRRDNYKSQPSIYFDDFVFKIFYQFKVSSIWNISVRKFIMQCKLMAFITKLNQRALKRKTKTRILLKQIHLMNIITAKFKKKGMSALEFIFALQIN